MIDIDSIAFGSDGLVPAVVRDRSTGALLMLAWMNRESLQKTLDERETWFWSRSRGALWHKGETSGNRQRVVGIRRDCDGDALVVDVIATGPACHTGDRSCFGDRDGLDLRPLTELLESRKMELPDDSYAASLFRDGERRIARKVMEEATEVVLAAIGETRDRLVEELADLVFHSVVLMVEKNIALRDVADELESRRQRRGTERQAPRTQSVVSYERELDVALRATRAAGEKALSYFRRPLDVRRKADLSPVTDADLAADRVFREIIANEFPDDGFLTEESGSQASRSSGRRWILDPIDGTKGFARGLPFWSVLAALEDGGEIVAGVAHFPALNTTYFARRGGGCFRNDARVHCSATERLEEASVQIAELRDLLTSEARDAIASIVGTAYVTRSIGDALAGCLVVDGSCDAWIERRLQPYDVAPFYILAPEAGARVTDWSGAVDPAGGSIAIAPPALHASVLALLGSARQSSPDR
jgi:phosphoribosyl-AMP cyclohydrolase / phosphoribosyl-ATP pyrophosphohydrolase